MDYRYKGFVFRPVHTTTEVRVKCGKGQRTEIRNLYEIVGLKEAGKRPFLTTVAECKEFIKEACS